MAETGTCEAIKVDGQPCTAYARPGTRWCWAHDPDLKEKRDEARSKGGRERMRRAAVLPEEAPDLPLATVADVVALLGQTINQTRKGALDPKVCNAVVQGASVLLRALEGGELAAQLEELR